MLSPPFNSGFEPRMSLLKNKGGRLNPEISKRQGWPHKLFPWAYHWDRKRFLETVYEKQTLRFYHSEAGSKQRLAGIKHTYYSKKFKTQNPCTNHAGVKVVLRSNTGTQQEQVIAKSTLVEYAHVHTCEGIGRTTDAAL